MVKENYPELSEAAKLHVLTEENVVAQLDHLAYSPVGSGSSGQRGRIQLHGWIYNIRTGEVQAWDAQPEHGMCLWKNTPGWCL